MEYQKNNNTGIIITITVLVMLVLGLIGFIVYDKVINKTNEPNNDMSGMNNDINDPNNNSTNDNDSITYTDYDLDDAAELIKKYYYDDSPNGVSTFDKMSEIDKAYIAFAHLDKSVINTKSCKSLYEDSISDGTVETSGNGVYQIVGTVLVCDQTTKVFSYDSLNNEFKKLFGSSNSVAKENFKISGWLFNLNEYSRADYVQSSNQFALLECRGTCGGSEFESKSIYDVLNAKLSSDGKLIVTVGYVVFHYEWGRTDNKPYVADFDSSLAYDYSIDVEENFIKNHADEVTKLEFIFEQENGNFVLTSFTKK